MKILFWIVIMVLAAIIGTYCQQSLFSSNSKHYDAEHDDVLVQKIADELERRMKQNKDD